MKEGHSLAHVLVYGFATVSVSTSLLAGYFVGRLTSSRALAVVVFAATLRQFYKIAGGIKGINGAIGDGMLSISKDLLAKDVKTAKGKAVKLVVVSDTHNNNDIVIPYGDILIHCGDFTMKGTSSEVLAFCDWLESQRHPHKVVICGNHDMGLEFESQPRSPEMAIAYKRLKGLCTLLQNSSANIEGLKFWGSPYTPYISKKSKMGFQDSSENLIKYWEQIPENIDVLITHGPPRNFGDRILLGKNVGCENLLKRVLEVKPRYHLFGHIHEAYGTYKMNNCVFVNAAICNLLYNPIHPPVVIDVSLNE